MDEEELASIQWRAVEWLNFYGPLTRENALDYFASSPFWDRNSTNQILAMQSIHTQEEHGGSLGRFGIEQFRQFTGPEFLLVESPPEQAANAGDGSLFVVRKQERLGPDMVRTLQIYHILNGNVYQAPDLYTILSTRLRGAMFHLDSALEQIRPFAQFQPGLDHSWRQSTKLADPSVGLGQST